MFTTGNQIDNFEQWNVLTIITLQNNTPVFFSVYFIGVFSLPFLVMLRVKDREDCITISLSFFSSFCCLPLSFSLSVCISAFFYVSSCSLYAPLCLSVSLPVCLSISSGFRFLSLALCQSLSLYFCLFVLFLFLLWWGWRTERNVLQSVLPYIWHSSSILPQP